MSNNWNGQGYPEVGEHILIDGVPDNRFNGREARVEAFFYYDGRACLAISSSVMGVSAIIFKSEYIKPIKSDRDKAVEEMHDMWIGFNGLFPHQFFQAIYDAGYRKTNSGE